MADRLTSSMKVDASNDRLHNDNSMLFTKRWLITEQTTHTRGLRDGIVRLA